VLLVRLVEQYPDCNLVIYITMHLVSTFVTFIGLWDTIDPL